MGILGGLMGVYGIQPLANFYTTMANGKLTISTGPCSIAMYQITRGYLSPTNLEAAGEHLHFLFHSKAVHCYILQSK